MKNKRKIIGICLGLAYLLNISTIRADDSCVSACEEMCSDLPSLNQAIHDFNSFYSELDICKSANLHCLPLTNINSSLNNIKTILNTPPNNEGLQAICGTSPGSTNCASFCFYASQLPVTETNAPQKALANPSQVQRNVGQPQAPRNKALQRTKK
jgi:hypothetical protein